MANAAELTNALELDSPDAAGILPDTATFIPQLRPFGKLSAIPLTPHKK